MQNGKLETWIIRKVTSMSSMIYLFGVRGLACSYTWCGEVLYSFNSDVHKDRQRPNGVSFRGLWPWNGKSTGVVQAPVSESWRRFVQYTEQ
ncbi:hypothetical protein EVAR_5531_1 [Eumeta japonica]|uniref:Uncharacterized protein n=1 Tax=Eumeta variegata TaxID=151549 RepID=A0A4C1TC08_EUMVA|nr:hypothetical protein EVAR_5531_1 [Eumeta japonica]